MIALIIAIGLAAGCCVLPVVAGFVGYRWGVSDGRLAEDTWRKQQQVDTARAVRAAELAEIARLEAEAAAPRPPAARPPGHGNYPHLLRHGTAASFTPRMAPAGRHHHAPVTPPPDDDTVTGMPPVPAAAPPTAPPAADPGTYGPGRGEDPYPPLRAVRPDPAGRGAFAARFTR